MFVRKSDGEVDPFGPNRYPLSDALDILNPKPTDIIRSMNGCTDHLQTMTLMGHIRDRLIVVALATALGLCVGCEEGPRPLNDGADAPGDVVTGSGFDGTEAEVEAYVGQTTSESAQEISGASMSAEESGQQPPEGSVGEGVGRQPATNHQPPGMQEEEMVDPCMNGIDPGRVVPRRLSTVEYWNAIDDLLGIDARDLAAFPPDEEVLGFDNQAASLQLSPIHAESFRGSAEAIAALAVEDLDALLGCSPDQSEGECLSAFIERFGRRAWRRPLDAEEAERLSALAQYGRTIADGGLSRGVSLVIEALLQSPNFLFRIEVGTPELETNGWRPLTSYEMASRLSFFLWRTTPDDTLLDAAENGDLLDETEIGRQVDRMLADPRSENAFWTFFEQWLHLDELKTLVRDPLRHPTFNGIRRAAMMTDARAFIRAIVWEEEASFTEIFARPFTIDGDVDDTRRAGILTHPSWLAVTSKPNMTSPIHRGVFVREQLLCMALPPPPPEAMVVAPDPDPNLTTREIFELHTADAACAGCHSLIDPIGLGFENFDEMGRWRVEENGHPINATGMVIATVDMDGPFEGAAQLADRLAESAQVHECIVTQVFRYAAGRGETAADACTIQQLVHRFADDGFNFKALVRAVATHTAFRMRKAVDGP
ncbi:MAG: DUF1588 domain-containing protein [Myxococcota bacterium]|nr:DUF1588 domain-containing protein [Myxococcota bacterium]